jgi:hypothetical protein
MYLFPAFSIPSKHIVASLLPKRPLNQLNTDDEKSHRLWSELVSQFILWIQQREDQQ